MTVTWGDALSEVDRLAEMLPPQDAARSALRGMTKQLSACPSSRLDACAEAAADLFDLVRRAQMLIDADPRQRDPYWSLRDCISDLSCGLADVLERVADPLFSSQQALENYLATLGSISSAVGLSEVIAAYDKPDQRRLVAGLAYRLARSRDPEGIAIWFRTPRSQLGDRTPAVVLDSDDTEAMKLLLPLAGDALSDRRPVVQ
jgi:hypothetical protein